MVGRRSGRSESVWLWTGDAEYDGHLLAVGENRLIARIRPADRWCPETGAPGMPVPYDVIERQRRLARRVGFCQSPEILEGALLEFRVAALQPSSDPHFVYVVAGSFAAVADEHLDALSRLDSNEALRYLQSCSSWVNAPSRLRSG